MHNAQACEEHTCQYDFRTSRALLHAPSRHISLRCPSFLYFPFFCLGLFFFLSVQNGKARVVPADALGFCGYQTCAGRLTASLLIQERCALPVIGCLQMNKRRRNKTLLLERQDGARADCKALSQPWEVWSRAKLSGNRLFPKQVSRR